MQTPRLANDIMVIRLVTLTPHMDVFEAIGLLLRHRISGAPVIDEQGNFLGVFSEKFSMSVLIASAYDELPTTEVAAFMNTDFGRVIDENTDLLSVAKMFLDTPYRRLPVLRDGKLLGQVSRRDVLRAQHDLSAAVRDRKTVLLDESAHIDCSDGTSEVAHGRCFDIHGHKRSNDFSGNRFAGNCTNLPEHALSPTARIARRQTGRPDQPPGPPTNYAWPDGDRTGA